MMLTTVRTLTMKSIFTTPAFNQWLSKLRDKIAVAKINARLRRATLGNLGDGALIRCALGDIAKAKGMSELAKQVGVSREGL